MEYKKFKIKRLKDGRYSVNIGIAYYSSLNLKSVKEFINVMIKYTPSR